MFERPRDPQDRRPEGWCQICGTELYEVPPARLCSRCREREEQDMSTLKELAAEYRASAMRLSERIGQLQQRQADCCRTEQESLRSRMATLYGMYRQTMDTAKKLEHYYGRE